jgi:hypothetical protein
VPNLMTDRRIGFAGNWCRVDVRRLMYQTLIWGEQARRRGDARGLRPALDAEVVEGLADSLVDGVRGNAELDRDLFRRQVLIDE